MCWNNNFLYWMKMKELRLITPLSYSDQLGDWFFQYYRLLTLYKCRHRLANMWFLCRNDDETVDNLLLHCMAVLQFVIISLVVQYVVDCSNMV